MSLTPELQAGFFTSGRGSPTNMFRFGILIAQRVGLQRRVGGKQPVQTENIGRDRIDLDQTLKSLA
jgi:hypothetical protein